MFTGEAMRKIKTEKSPHPWHPVSLIAPVYHVRVTTAWQLRNDFLNDSFYSDMEVLLFPFGVTIVVVGDLLVGAFQYIHHFIVAQVVPELRGYLDNILILVVFKIIFDQEALQGIGDDQSSKLVVANCSRIVEESSASLHRQSLIGALNVKIPELSHQVIHFYFAIPVNEFEQGLYEYGFVRPGQVAAPGEVEEFLPPLVAGDRPDLEVKVGANLLDAIAPEIVVVTLPYPLIAIGLQFTAFEPAAQPVGVDPFSFCSLFPI